MPHKKKQNHTEKSESSESAEKIQAENEICKGDREPSEIVVETYKNDMEDEKTLASGSQTKKDEPSTERIGFFSGNPFIEKTQGILHIYKQNDAASPEADSCMLCMLAVPALVTCPELLQFLAPVSSSLAQMKVLRNKSPNQYMVLLKFRSQQEADTFYESYQGIEFNSIEQYVCRLVYVARLETVKECWGGSVAVDGHTELPTCPVCLERMDESVDGILTVLCNHSFHTTCLAKWGDTSCPVCRYSQTPELSQEQKCSACGKQADLWICLICGYIGCGRYAEAHSFQHFRETSHTFSMQVGGQRVWDYAGDNYVHRLIQSKGDGKVVEFEPSQRSAEDVDSEEKTEAITLEYTYLLSNQLEAQRCYFEEKLAKMEQIALTQMEDLEGQVRRVVDECQSLRSQLENVTSEKQQLERKSTQSSTKVQKLSTQLRDEQQINKMLRQDQQKWNEQVNALKIQIEQTNRDKDAKITDLEEQLRDLMFHLQAENKIKEAASETQDEVKDGHIVLGEAAPQSPNKSKKGKKKR